MTNFTDEFLKAFNHAMIYEIGPNFNAEDDDTIVGRIATPAQRKKIGYVNIPADKGGETKYGIAQNSNSNLNVRDLDLASAMEIYYHEYYVKGSCNKLSFPLNIIHFDGCVNHGVSKACKFLQTASGMSSVQVDGVIGSNSLARINANDPKQLILSISEIRNKFYHSIVQKTPSQGIFLKGWLRRIKEVTEYSVAQLD